MNCTVCNKNTFKYKCPKCSAKYCSIPCYKTHQSICTGIPQPQPPSSPPPTFLPVPPPPTSQPPPPTTEPPPQPSNNILSIQQLELLKSNEDLREMVKNSELQDLLVSIRNNPQLLDQQDPKMKDFIKKVIDIINK